MLKKTVNIGWVKKTFDLLAILFCINGTVVVKVLGDMDNQFFTYSSILLDVIYFIGLEKSLDQFILTNKLNNLSSIQPRISLLCFFTI